MDDGLLAGRTLVSVDTEGQDRKILWTSVSGETRARLVATSGDAVYLTLHKTGSDISWDLLRVPLDGSEARTVAQSLTFYAPTGCDMGDRLIIFENGDYITDGGKRAISMSYDGTNQVMYPLG